MLSNINSQNTIITNPLDRNDFHLTTPSTNYTQMTSQSSNLDSCYQEQDTHMNTFQYNSTQLNSKSDDQNQVTPTTSFASDQTEQIGLSFSEYQATTERKNKILQSNNSNDYLKLPDIAAFAEDSFQKNNLIQQQISINLLLIDSLAQMKAGQDHFCICDGESMYPLEVPYYQIKDQEIQPQNEQENTTIEQQTGSIFNETQEDALVKKLVDSIPSVPTMTPPQKQPADELIAFKDLLKRKVIGLFQVDNIESMEARQRDHDNGESSYNRDHHSFAPHIMRQTMMILLDWLFECGTEFSLKRDTVYQAQSIILRALQPKAGLDIQIADLQVSAIAAMLLATKLQEEYSFPLTYLQPVFDPVEILRQEARTAKALKFEFSDVPLSQWAFLIMQQWDKFAELSFSMEPVRASLFRRGIKKHYFFKNSHNDLVLQQVMGTIDLISCDMLYQDQDSKRLVASVVYLCLTEVFNRYNAKILKTDFQTMNFERFEIEDIYNAFLNEACSFIGAQSVRAMQSTIAFANEFFVAPHLRLEQLRLVLVSASVRALSNIDLLNYHINVKKIPSFQTHNAANRMFLESRMANHNAAIVHNN